LVLLLWLMPTSTLRLILECRKQGDKPHYLQLTDGHDEQQQIILRIE
jgi:hypothetical protein